MARQFSSFARIPIAVNDISTETLAVIGGIVYYRGILVNPQADDILSEMSSYIEVGRERLRVSDGYLDFVPSCPLMVDENSHNCVFNSQDAAAFTCTTLSEAVDVSCSSDSAIPPNVALILVAVFGGLLVVLIPCSLMLCCCVLRMRKLKLKCHRESTQFGTKTAPVGYLGQQGNPNQLKSQSSEETVDKTRSKRHESLDSAIGEMRRASSGTLGDNSVFHGD